MNFEFERKPALSSKISDLLLRVIQHGGINLYSKYIQTSSALVVKKIREQKFTKTK